VGLLAVVALPPWRVVAQDKPAPAASSQPPDKPDASRPSTTREAQPSSPAGPRQRYVGRLVAETLRLQSAADGVVLQVRVHNGDRVKKGDLILELDAERARAGLAQAEARLKLVETQMTRLTAILDQKAASLAEVDEKRVEVQIAQAEIQIRKQDLMDTRVVAPFDGAVELTTQAGQRVTKGEALGRLIAVDAPRAMFQVPEDSVRDLKVGRPAEVTVAAFPGRAFRAEISEISPTIDPATATVTVYARFTEGTEGLLPGMFAEVGLRSVNAPPQAAKP
jgi:membrane fusion protein (multidrug efflux system)